MTFSDDKILERLSSLGLKSWELKDEKLIKNFQFTSFKEAINFVNKVAEISEILDHHPIITISWKTVKISLKSFDVKAITERDFKLACKIENSIKSA